MATQLELDFIVPRQPAAPASLPAPTATSSPRTSVAPAPLPYRLQPPLRASTGFALASYYRWQNRRAGGW